MQELKMAASVGAPRSPARPVPAARCSPAHPCRMPLPHAHSWPYLYFSASALFASLLFPFQATRRRSGRFRRGLSRTIRGTLSRRKTTASGGGDDPQQQMGEEVAHGRAAERWLRCWEG